ncbi:RidA family protein [Rosettibacter firmus]|uniref:RidA family protein n=1 Tax=Rosettibacter firmus TaxID=3111522 RepID=UPI00336BDC95
MYEQKIREILGFDLPNAPKPIAAYVPANRIGDFIFTSGQLPIKNGKLIAEGKVGYEVGEEKAKECAQMCVVNCLSAIKSLIGDLDRIEQIVKLTVYVNSRIGYLEQPKIANGASEFLINVFGEKGKHARSAVGVSDLPLNAPVEIEMVVLVK